MFELFNVWKENTYYPRGSIISLFNGCRTEWFVCKESHNSCNLVYPNNCNDYYWEYIQDQFVDYITQQGIEIGIYKQQNEEINNVLQNGLWDTYTPKKDCGLLKDKSTKTFYCLSACVENCDDCELKTDILVLEKESLKTKDGYIDCLMKCQTCFIKYFENENVHKRKIKESEIGGIYFEQIIKNGECDCKIGNCKIYKVTNLKKQIILKKCEVCINNCFLDSFYKEEIVIDKKVSNVKGLLKIKIQDQISKPVHPPPKMPLPAPPGIKTFAIKSKSDTENEIADVFLKRKSKFSDHDDVLMKKLKCVEDEIDEFIGKTVQNKTLSRYDEILLLDANLKTKHAIREKYLQINLENGSDKEKSLKLFNNLMKLPFNKKKEYDINLDTIKEKLNDAVWGQNETKDEILQFFAKKISNPNSKGQILALHGAGGTGKTKIIRDGLANAIGLPFFQINCGGLNDVDVLTGHSSTYVGSKPGKFVDILTECGYNNPIIYLDELDKVSESRMRSIYGILTHIFDEDQNSNFQDNYFGNIDIDLSNVLFVVSFNHKENISPILLNRLRIIDVPDLEIKDKLKIAQKMIIEIKDSIWGKDNTLTVEVLDETVEYLLNKLPIEKGVRTMKKSFERILENINMKSILNKEKLQNIKITKTLIDGILNIKSESKDYMCMYS